MSRGNRIHTVVLFIAVDHDGDEAVAQMDGKPMMVIHDKPRLMRLREFMHHYAIANVETVREVVFVRASGKRYHCEFDAPDDYPWYRGTEYQVIDLFHDECNDPDCHRRHVYMNYPGNRAQDAARARKLKRRSR